MRRLAVALALLIAIASFAMATPFRAVATTLFAAKSDYATGGFPTSVVAGDFNGDGSLDLAVGNSNVEESGPLRGFETVSILLGNGDGTFRGKVDYRTGSRAYPIALATGDVNHDGKLDLLAADYGRNEVSVLLGNGDGGFSPNGNYPTGPSPESIASGDFNGDGNLDVVVGNRADIGTVSILLGNGDGTFQPKLDYLTHSDPTSVATGDFDNDGKLDLAVVIHFPDRVAVLRGNGEGGFVSQTNYPAGPYPSGATTGDFNGDGNLDLAVTSGLPGSVSVLLGKGDGTFGRKADYRTRLNPESVATADFNSDGNLDLATANYDDNTASVLLGNGDGTFQTHTDYNVGKRAASLVAADLQERGTFDIAIANTESDTISVLLNNGASPLPYKGESAIRYTLVRSDGRTWMLMDPSRLERRIVSSCTCSAVVSANVLLATNARNPKQDIGIRVSGGGYGPFPGTVVAWKEFSKGGKLSSGEPASVEMKVPVQANAAYSVTLVWKANRVTNADIVAGTGRAGSPQSRTSLSIQIPRRP